MRWIRLGELRAGRKRLLIGFSLVPVILCALVLLRIHRSPSIAPSAASLAEEASSTPEKDLVTRISDTVRRGDTFSALLLRNRVGVQDITRVLNLNRRLQLFSPRSLKPGQTLELERDDYGRLQKLSFRLSPEETYVFESQDDSLIAYLLPVERNIRLRKFEGEVQTGVDEAIRKAGGDYRLTLKFADVFAYDVDFFTEVHKGDRFSLLVEERFADGKFVGYGEILYGRYDGKSARTVACYAPAHGTRRGGYYDRQGQALRKAFLRSPLNYRRISSTFSKARFHPILKTFRPHHGVDYAAAAGTPVVAVADGLIEYAGWKGGYGKFVRLRHSGGTESGYGHLSRLGNGIRSGARVRQGEVIGYVGSTGLATGPHLHYEVVQKGVPVNPLALKNLPSDPMPADQMAWFHDFTGRLEELNTVLLAGQVLESFDPTHLPGTLAQLQSAEGPAVR